MERHINLLLAVLGIGYGIFAQSPSRIWDHIVSMGYDIPTNHNVMLGFNGDALPSVTVLENTASYQSPLAVSDPVTGALKFIMARNALFDATGNETPNSGLWASAANGHGYVTVIPHPGARDRYYLITRVCGIPCSEYRWTLYDGTLNGGLGDVDPELVDQPWFTGGIGDLHGMIASADGNTYWFITHEPGNADWTLHPITAAEGIDADPVTITGGPLITDASSYTSMWMVVAPSNNKLALRYKSGGTFQLALLGFDNVLGTFNGMEATLPYSTERRITFSPGGTYMYKEGVNDLGEGMVDQYDLEAGDGTAIWNSRQQAAIPDLQGQQMASLLFSNTADGRIWIEGITNTMYFTHKIIPINEPDLPAPACDVSQGLELGVEFISSFWLPTMWWPVLSDASALDETGATEQGSALAVSPNPAAEQITIIAPAGMVVRGAELVLLDHLGRTVQRLPWRTGTSNFMVDVSDLPAGMYSAVLLGDEGFMGTARFLRR